MASDSSNSHPLEISSERGILTPSGSSKSPGSFVSLVPLGSKPLHEPGSATSMLKCTHRPGLGRMTTHPQSWERGVRVSPDPPEPPGLRWGMADSPQKYQDAVTGRSRSGCWTGQQSSTPIQPSCITGTLQRAGKERTWTLGAAVGGCGCDGPG